MLLTVIIHMLQFINSIMMLGTSMQFDVGWCDNKMHFFPLLLCNKGTIFKPVLFSSEIFNITYVVCERKL